MTDHANILSFSGGKDSTALYLYALERGGRQWQLAMDDEESCSSQYGLCE